jgi:hypothetical protein
MTQATDAFQSPDVVPCDQSARRVAHQVDALAPVIARDLLDPLRQDASQFLHRACVETTEKPAELDVMSAVSRSTEPICEPANNTRRCEETV